MSILSITCYYSDFIFFCAAITSYFHNIDSSYELIFWMVSLTCVWRSTYSFIQDNYIVYVDLKIVWHVFQDGLTCVWRSDRSFNQDNYIVYVDLKIKDHE
jgi:hypothetical protein